MCGRYATTVDPALLAVELDAIDETRSGTRVPEERHEAANYNVAPTDPVLAVVSRHSREHPDDAPRRRIRRMRWGLVPSWTKADEQGRPVRSAPLINARADTAASKPAFRTALTRTRCLVPMDGWYEWVLEPSAAGKAVKVPYFMTPTDGSRLYAAGLWSVWHDRAASSSSPLLSCTILTTDAVGELTGVHDRMPLVLGDGQWDRWLDPDAEPDAELLAGPSAAEVAGIEIRRVSQRVNSVANDGPDLIAPADPVGPAVGEQISLL
ncbi:SOS response-associated peptidase [Rhodococcus kronopolitis]|uniref:Abasic site processing protein n=1 Tax=Rhodococcus kronopolitis TaxID=1460226 RepID=A0ABV9FMI1_9NOCA